MRRVEGLRWFVNCSFRSGRGNGAAVGFKEETKRKTSDESVIFLIRISRLRAKKMGGGSALVSSSDFRFSCQLVVPETPLTKVI
jgi:hypothetical protein